MYPAVIAKRPTLCVISNATLILLCQTEPLFPPKLRPWGQQRRYPKPILASWERIRSWSRPPSSTPGRIRARAQRRSCELKLRSLASHLTAMHLRTTLGFASVDGYGMRLTIDDESASAGREGRLGVLGTSPLDSMFLI